MRIMHKCCILLIGLFLFAVRPSLAADLPALPPAPVLLSLDYSEASLATVLKSIAYSYDLNLVIATEIKGKVTAQLKNVSLDEALNAILRVNKYGFSRKDNIVYIVPQSEVDLTTDFISLNYLLAKDAKAFLGKLLSKMGDVQVNEATNSLVIRDLPENIAKVKEMLKGVDQPPLQVLIEAKIVDINRTDAQTLGTALSTTVNNTNGHLHSATLDTGTAATAITDGGLLSLTPSFKSLTNTNVTIDALVKQERARVLASPSIATLTGQEARIIIGNRYPYQQSSVTGSTTSFSTQYLDTGTTLRVTPMVSPDGWITMKVHPEVSSATQTTAGPLVSTREADATIRVKDNETIVIGGLISSNDSSSQDGVPGLRSIPVLGWFFKRHIDSDIKTELVVFITPHIMRSPGQEVSADNVPKPAPVKPITLSLPNEVRIDTDALTKDSDMLTGLLSYVSDLESDADRKKSDDLYLTLELVKTYRMILKEFPSSGKSDYCLSKIATLYVKKFGKCSAAQEALSQLETNFPKSPYLDDTRLLVQTCPKEPAVRQEPAKAVLK